MFKVYLVNGETITENKCSWKLLPTIPIVKFEYTLPNRRVLRMEGFEKYIFAPEISYFLNIKKMPRIDVLNFLGRNKYLLYQFSINITKTKKRPSKAMQRKDVTNKDEFCPLIWNPTKKQYEFGKPRPFNSNLWHSGVPLKIPKVQLI